MKEQLNSILFAIAGLLFIISGIIGKNFMFMPIGFCFIILGITNINKEK